MHRSNTYAGLASDRIGLAQLGVRVITLQALLMLPVARAAQHGMEVRSGKWAVSSERALTAFEAEQKKSGLHLEKRIRRKPQRRRRRRWSRHLVPGPMIQAVAHSLLLKSHRRHHYWFDEQQCSSSAAEAPWRHRENGGV